MDVLEWSMKVKNMKKQWKIWNERWWWKNYLNHFFIFFNHTIHSCTAHSISLLIAHITYHHLLPIYDTTLSGHIYTHEKIKTQMQQSDIQPTPFKLIFCPVILNEKITSSLASVSSTDHVISFSVIMEIDHDVLQLTRAYLISGKCHVFDCITAVLQYLPWYPCQQEMWAIFTPMSITLPVSLISSQFVDSFLSIVPLD